MEEPTEEKALSDEILDNPQLLHMRERALVLDVSNSSTNRKDVTAQGSIGFTETGSPREELEGLSPPASDRERYSSSFRPKSLKIAKDEEGQSRVLMTGWATKESGQAYFGKHNWRRRWFALSLSSGRLILTYSEKINSQEPKGIVCLSQDYSARELETGIKGKPNCFALGPVLDKSALRTYYISCDTEDQRLEWIVMINSAIEGVPEKALKRKSTYKVKKRKRVITRAASEPTRPCTDDNSFLLHSWRMSQWNIVCDVAKNAQWKRFETKDGVTISRQSFKDSEFVVVKIEGVIDAPVDVTFEFMQRSVKPGGKFDFAFRKEELVQKVEEKCSTAYITRNVYNVPLPGMKKRDVCLLRTWVPTSISKDETCGLFLSSVNHPQAPKTKEFERAIVLPSGIILRGVNNDGDVASTEITAILQVDLRDALQNMLRGSYKSGVFRTGLRNFFNHLRRLVQSYYELVRI